MSFTNLKGRYNSRRCNTESESTSRHQHRLSINKLKQSEPLHQSVKLPPIMNNPNLSNRSTRCMSKPSSKSHSQNHKKSLPNSMLVI